MSEQARYTGEDADRPAPDRDATPSQQPSGPGTAYEAVFETVEKPVVLFDVEHGEELTVRFRRNNPAHEELTGIATETARGRAPREIFDGARGAIVTSHCRECVETREPVEFEETVEQSGQSLERRTTLRPVVEGGEVTALVGTVEQRAPEPPLPPGKTEFRALFDGAPDGIVVHDADGNLLRVNDTLVEMLGYTREELQSMRVPDFEVGIDETRLRERWADIEPGGMRKIAVEGTHRRKDGSTYPVETWVSKVSATEWGTSRDRTAADSRFIAHVRDVTERKNREEELETQRDDLEILNQVVRHDIRNDLQLVEAYAELLEDHVDEGGEEYLETVLESAENAVALTTTARELAEVMLRPSTESRRVSLRENLERHIGDIRSAHSEAVVAVDGALPDVTVRGDDMLGSVFRNLLKNAIQHNDKEVPEVTVSARDRDGRVEVRVADNGPGIPDDQREDIFGRGEKGLETGGTGLGLYLVRSLVDGYDGDVWVEDGVDATGAVFVVELPVAE